MKAVFSVAPVLVYAFALNAQITATLNRLPDGVDEVSIRNNSAISLVAFVVTVKQVPLSEAGSSAPFVVYSDPLIEPAAKPLLSKEERVVMTRGFRDRSGKHLRLLEEPIATAGILADGSTTGDTALLVRLDAAPKQYAVGGGDGARNAIRCRQTQRPTRSTDCAVQENG